MHHIICSVRGKMSLIIIEVAANPGSRCAAEYLIFLPNSFLALRTDGSRAEENKELRELADADARARCCPSKSDSANGPDAEEDEEEEDL